MLSCGQCEGLIQGKRSDAKYCSESCRQKAKRRRKNPSVGTPEAYWRQRDALDMINMGEAWLKGIPGRSDTPKRFADGEHDDAWGPEEPRFHGRRPYTPTEGIDGAVGGDLYTPYESTPPSDHNLYNFAWDGLREYGSDARIFQWSAARIAKDCHDHLHTILRESNARRADEPGSHYPEHDREERMQAFLERLERLEEQNTKILEQGIEILVRLGDDQAISSEVDRFLNSAQDECGVKVFDD